jgi:hypothetical protein
VIPREVSLLDEELTGWSAYLFSHMLPKLSAHIDTDANESQTNSNEQQVGPPMWRIEDNELRAGKGNSEDAAKPTAEAQDHPSESNSGDPFAEKATTSQSNMTYARPLCEGEQIEYEFFHQPDVHNASPSVGRIAYLIRDGKIALRWISTGAEARESSRESNSLGDDPAAEVLAQVKLEANSWNRVQMRLEGGKVVLSIAGTDVYRRPLEKDTVARFGFFCDPTKDQVRIRNVLLKGDWPTELPSDLWELN